MDNLIFNDEKKTTIHIPGLTQSDKEGNENFSTIDEEKRNKGQVELSFFGNGYDFTITPSTQQENALQYIQTHQKELAEAFFKYTKDVLYPVHIEFIGFDDVSFPKINEVGDLRKSLGLREAYIWKEHKNGISYVAFSFDFTGDFEHGVILIAHENRILGWEEDLVNDKILADIIP